MVSQPESVNAQIAECDLLLTGGRVINRKTVLNDVADVAISAGTVVAMALSPQGARTI
jgi:predicted amidohydrolase